LSLPAYAERTAQVVAAWKAVNGKQAGDPVKLAQALVQLVDRDDPPLRWLAGADAVAAGEQKVRTLLAQIELHRDLSIRLAHDDAATS